MSPSTPLGTNQLTAVRVVGGLLPAGLLPRLTETRPAGRQSVPGLESSTYHLLDGETPRGVAAQAWSRLSGAWRSFRAAAARQPDKALVGLTRDKWLMPLVETLGYGRLPSLPSPGLVVDDKTFPVSHDWGDVPVHLLGVGVDLDRRTPGVPGAAEAAPQPMVQELLNRSPQHQWALLSNGLRLRLLRDSTNLAGPSYVEFDLEAIFDGELFAEFVLLYLLVHVSRLEPLDDPKAQGGCWLERWRTFALTEGVRALKQLRLSVKAAVETLGSGFLARNPDLRTALAPASPHPDALDARTYNQLLLRLVYRLLFLFVAEDRDALHPADAEEEARRRYAEHFSTARLRRLATRRRGSVHTDSWEGLRIVFTALSTEGGQPLLALPGLGGLFEADADDPASEPGTLGLLERCTLDNESLFTAIRSLTLITPPDGGRPEQVDYRNLDSEELGSVYEGLLAYEPRVDLPERTFTLEELEGNQRKTTGSYYTPASLTAALLETVLDPILHERADAPTQVEAERALLAVTVCDPACGSGHFLVAAARRIAKKLASVRTEEAEPPTEDVRHALHEVIDQCVYGVDRNPMAVELAKVSLWMEALEPGRPLAFLDAQIRVGNSLLGATPALLAKGITDKAFTPLTGDNTATAKENTQRNRRARRHNLDQLAILGPTDPAAELHHRARRIGMDSGDDLATVHRIRDTWRALERSPKREHARLIADAWCAAFVWPLTKDGPEPITQTMFNTLRANPDETSGEIRRRIARLREEYGFFHWHLEFPTIFTVAEDGGPVPEGGPTTGWGGGFTCVVGNPPWERVKLQEKEFFATRDREIADAPNAAARRKLIARLPETNPELDEAWKAASRRSDGESLILRESGRYPGCGRGDVNTYMVFTEAAVTLVDPHGRSGVIVPTQIATGDTTAEFFSGLVTDERLVALHDFENEDKLFSDVHHQQRFCVLVVNGARRAAGEIAFSFYARHPRQIPELVFRLKPDEITLLNPNTGTCPVFRSRRDAEITLGIYRRHPVLIRENTLNGNPWGVRFSTMLHMANDSSLFHTAGQLTEIGGRFDGWSWTVRGERYLPLYEAKMVHHYDHRFATYEGATKPQLNQNTLPRMTIDAKTDPTAEPLARYWVREADLVRKLTERREKGEKTLDWTNSNWLLGWRDVARSVDSRTFIGSVIPSSAVGHKFPLAVSHKDFVSLVATVSSFVFDFIARQKLSAASMAFFVLRQLPVPAPTSFEKNPKWSTASFRNWATPRVLELVYTSWTMEGFAHDCGDGGPPFVWDEERRRLLRAELDAAMFHVYGLERDEVEHVMDSFNVIRDSELRASGEYRTKQRILAIYDAMADATKTGVPYTSPLNPPPGAGPRHSPDTRPNR